MDLLKDVGEKNLHAIVDLRYYALAWTTILYFDWFLTLPSEIRCVWKAKMSAASALYVVNRYLAMGAYIPVLVGYFNPNWSSAICSTFAPFNASINTINQFIIGIILVLRTYALYQRRIAVLIVVGISAIVAVALGAWAASQVQGWYLHDPRFGMCIPSLEDSGRGLKLSWIATFIFDFIVFILTVARTVRLITAHKLIHLRSSLASILLRDGSLYFFSLCAANIANFIWVTHDGTGSFLASCVTGTNSIFYHILSVVLLSRLILNLREENLRRSTPNASIIAPNDPHGGLGIGMDLWSDNINNLFSHVSTIDQMVFRDRTSGLTLVSIDGMLPIRDSEIFGSESESDLESGSGSGSKDSRESTQSHCTTNTVESQCGFETCACESDEDDINDGDEYGYVDHDGEGASANSNNGSSQRERSDSQRALIAQV